MKHRPRSKRGGPPFLALAEELASRSGWRISVLRTSDAAPVHSIVLPDWDRWKPTTAGDRLIEHGYAVVAIAHFGPERVGGWLQIGESSYTAPVYTRTELAS
jgi:hypothetical protein